MIEPPFAPPLGRLSRARLTLAGSVVRRLFASPRFVRAFAARRRDEGLEASTAAMLVLEDLLRMPKTWELSPAVARAKMVESIALADAPVDGPVLVEEHRIPGDAGDLRARLYAPPGLENGAPGVVFFHGGGWVVGDLNSHDTLCRRYALGARARVFAVDYRLAPEHPFPAPGQDAVAAFRWVAQNAEALGMDPFRLAVAGDSAGGNLAAIVGLKTRGDARRPALAVLIYPATDATCSSRSHAELGRGYYLTRESIDWYVGHYLGTDPALRKHPDVSPTYAESVGGSPPTLVVTAELDPLRDEAMDYAERLRKEGVPVTARCVRGVIHGFAMMTSISPASRTAVVRLIEETGAALRSGRLPDP